MQKRTRVLIMGAAGRDFHNFNVVYRADAATEVVAFTAAPIDLAALIPLNKPVLRARYEFAEAEAPGLGAIVEGFLASRVR